MVGWEVVNALCICKEAAVVEHPLYHLVCAMPHLSWPPDVKVPQVTHLRAGPHVQGAAALDRGCLVGWWPAAPACGGASSSAAAEVERWRKLCRIQAAGASVLRLNSRQAAGRQALPLPSHLDVAARLKTI